MTTAVQLQLSDTYLRKLGDLFHSEKLLIEGLAKMAHASMSPDISMAFRTHGDETRMQERRLFDILNRLDQKPDLLKPTVISVQQFADDADAVIGHDTPQTEREIRLLAIARQVEQHEIKAYKDALQMALSSDDVDTAEQLRESLLEEQHAEQKVAELQAVNDGGPEHRAFTKVTPGEFTQPDTQYGKNPVAEARAEVF
jgi:ferritin-like metal-binding protein YciE